MQAIKAARERGLVFDGVHVDSDAKAATAQLSRWCSRSPHRTPLETLAQWVKDGLYVSVAWHPRTAPSALVADELSRATSTADWSLTEETVDLLWHVSRGWSLDMFATEEHRWADDYCAIRAPVEERRRLLLAGFSSNSAHFSIGHGFLGDAASVDISRTSAFAFPPWSLIPTAVNRFQAASDCRLTLVMKSDPAAWWYPPVTEIAQFLRVTFPISAIMQPRPFLVAPDGSHKHLPGIVACVFQKGNRPRLDEDMIPRWVARRRDLLARCGDIHPNPGPRGSLGWLFSARPATPPRHSPPTTHEHRPRTDTATAAPSVSVPQQEPAPIGAGTAGQDRG